MFGKKMIKIEEDKFDKFVSKYRELEKTIEYLKFEASKYKTKAEKLEAELDEINSLDINTSTVRQRDKAINANNILSAENKSLKSEIKYLRTSNNSNEILLKESLTLLKRYGDSSSTLEDLTYKIDEIC